MQPLPKKVRDIQRIFYAHSYQIFLVGGSVRDMLLQRPITNWDFATDAKPDDIQKLFPDSFYNNTYGTVTVPIRNKRKTPILVEITSFRKEGKYHDARHPSSVRWAKTIEEDLKRRDFTINAMAYDGKTIIDPHGGKQDLIKGTIRTVGNANHRFAEDALRLMRAVRFASELGFLIDEQTRDAISDQAAAITAISWERIRDEFLKILASPHPAEGILFLRNTGLLAYILPEVNICFSVPQKSPKRHHVYDVGTHLVNALKHCPSPDPITRFATLIHDIGKAQTFRKSDKTQIITFYNHEVVGAQQAEAIAKRFRLSSTDQKKLITLVANHQFTVSETQSDKAVRRFIRSVGKEYIGDILDLRTADRIGSGARATSWRTELFKKRIIEVQKQPFSITDLKITGNDVMKITGKPPGPAVGKILKNLFENVEEKKLPNTRTALLTAVKKMRLK